MRYLLAIKWLLRGQRHVVYEAPMRDSSASSWSRSHRAPLMPHTLINYIRRAACCNQNTLALTSHQAHIPRWQTQQCCCLAARDSALGRLVLAAIALDNMPEAIAW
jgi:hypothetical protein